MSIPRIVESDQGPKRRGFRGPRVPPNLFAIVLGIAGLAQAWDAAGPLLGTPRAIPTRSASWTPPYGWSWSARTWPRVLGWWWLTSGTRFCREDLFPAWPPVHQAGAS
jgi:hypothetical protein